MPEATNPNPASGAPPAPAAAPPAQAAPPAEDYRVKYEESEKRWKETEPRLKSLERWEKWGDPDQFEKNLAARIEARDKELRSKWEAEHRQPTQPQQPTDPYEGIELLDPRGQALRIQNIVAEGVKAELAKQVDNYWKTAEGRIGEIDQRFSLLSRALSARSENPDLNLDGLWKEASTLATGDQNKLFELAVERLLAPKKMEKQIAEAVAAEKAKWEQEQANKNQAALVGSGNGASAASFKDTIAARRGEGDAKGLEALKMRILNKMVGDGQLHPSQV